MSILAANKVWKSSKEWLLTPTSWPIFYQALSHSLEIDFALYSRVIIGPGRKKKGGVFLLFNQQEC